MDLSLRENKIENKNIHSNDVDVSEAIRLVALCDFAREIYSIACEKADAIIPDWRTNVQSKADEEEGIKMAEKSLSNCGYGSKEIKIIIDYLKGFEETRKRNLS